MSHETLHIIRAMKATGNRPGIIADWKADMEAWAMLNPGDPNAAAVQAWLPLWQVRPFYRIDELAPMWPALAIATGFTTRWPAVPKSAKRIEFELDFYELPRLVKPYREFFICERVHFWRGATAAEIQREIERA